MEKAKRRSTRNGGEVIGHIAEIMAAEFKKCGIQSSKAEQAVAAISEAICFNFGGNLVYFNNGKQQKHDHAALDTLAGFNDGMTVSELASEAGISVGAVYSRLARARILQAKRDTSL